MFQKVFVVFTLLAVLLVATAASSAGHNKRTDVLQQLLAKKEKASQQPEPEPKPAWVERRVERRVQLSDDEREIMTKQIMQAISGKLPCELQENDSENLSTHKCTHMRCAFVVELVLSTLSLLCLLC